jgi:hypothetical protein
MPELMTQEEIRSRVEKVLEDVWWTDESGMQRQESSTKIVREFAQALEDAGLLAKPGDQEISDPRHIIQYDEDGMTVLHPLSCRPGLFDCKVWIKARQSVTEPPTTTGKYYCGLDADGNFDQQEAVED